MSLTPEIIESLKSALQKLTGNKRRSYAAELCTTYFDNSPRKVERALGVSREMTKLGLQERRSGICCLENYHLRGRKKKNA
jgi:hypothetical protein